MTLTISQRVQAIEESSTVKLFGQVEALKASGKQIITFNLGEPDFDPPAPIMNATRKALDENQTKYSANPGLKTLREAILAKLKHDNGIDAKLENILVANGSKQVLYNLFQTILNPGDEVIVLRPYWVTFPEGIKLAGGVPVFVDTVEHQPDLALIEAAITPKTKAVLINSPNNPTGALYPAETLRAIGHLCLQKGVYLISDEAYDALEAELKKIDPKNTVLELIGSPIDSSSEKVAHQKKMLSLEKSLLVTAKEEPILTSSSGLHLMKHIL
jgi:aspartate aminotransferase